MTTSFSWWLVLFIPASSGFSPSSSSSMTAIGQLRTAHEGSSNRLIAQEPLLASLLAEPSVELVVANNDVAPKEEQIFFANEAKTSDSSIVPLKGMEIVMLPDVPSRYQKIQPGRYSNKDNSIAIPLLKRPPALDGSHAGDCGFDPFGFTETYDLYTMQEAELRHARLAMLAVVGWPLSELVAPQWMLQNENGCAPSVLNGFNPVSFLGFLAIFGAIGFIEFKTCFRQVANTPSGRLHQSDMADVWKWGVAGDYGFDPLNLYSSIGNDAYSRKGLRDVEISHGRSAMLAITYFAFSEAITGHPIVENSMFFHPNLLLPILAAGYFAFNSIYELEESDTFVRFQLNSEGSAKLENLKLAFRSSEDDNSNESALVPRSETIMNTVSDIKDLVLSLDVEGMLKGLEKGKQ